MLVLQPQIGGTTVHDAVRAGGGCRTVVEGIVEEGRGCVDRCVVVL